MLDAFVDEALKRPAGRSRGSRLPREAASDGVGRSSAEARTSDGTSRFAGALRRLDSGARTAATSVAPTSAARAGRGRQGRRPAAPRGRVPRPTGVVPLIGHPPAAPDAGPAQEVVHHVAVAQASSTVPWHQSPPPVSGHRDARRGAQLGAFLYVTATIVYLVAWDLRAVGQLCFRQDDGPPCPPPPAEPAEWLTAARWVVWSTGALLVLAALVLAGRASAGRSTASSVWRLLAGAAGSGLLFSVLVLVGP